jgi:hypothetical protein
MKNTQMIALVASGVLVALSLGTSVAEAGIGACGNIHVEANAECELAVDGGCELRCQPVSFEAACAGQLYVECKGLNECNASASASCTAECTGSCEARCTVDPGSFDCRAECEADLDARCDAQCASDANKSECRASCKATFSGECDASCSGTPPTADCQAKCQASCQGQCKAQVNVDCQIECQREGHLECKTRLEGGCKGRCREPNGALFCDGNYVDHGGNLQECINALKAQLNVTVDASATGRANCSGNRCTAEGEAQASASCAVAPSASTQGWVFALIGAVGAMTIGRRRRHAKQRR